MIYARSSVVIAAVLFFSTQGEAFFNPMKAPDKVVVEKPQGPGCANHFCMNCQEKSSNVRSIADGSTGLPGDIGFDPLSLANVDLLLDSATDKSRSKARVLRDYRDAELKHGRLAMLAAVAFPLQEKLNPLLAAQFRMPNLVAETGGLSPTVLNGGLEQGPIPAAVLAFAVLVSLVELRGLDIKKAEGDSWVPGDYGTLRIAERGSEQYFSLQEGEIWNSRIAMLAILGYVVQEVVTGLPISYTIPFFGS